MLAHAASTSTNVATLLCARPHPREDGEPRRVMSQWSWLGRRVGAVRRSPRKARYCDWFDDKCCFENFDKFWKNNGKYRCKICFQLQNSILILGNLAFIADCNLYFGQNLYNIFSLIPKCIRFSPQITDNSLLSLFVTVKTANNTGFNLYGKYRLVLRR